LLLTGESRIRRQGMSTIDVNSVLAQIRSLSAQAQAQGATVHAKPDTAPVAANGGFGTMVTKAIDGVNDAQQAASAMQNKFELGDPSVDLSSVMLATSKAQLQFRAMVEVRNRLVTAYQDIMNMPL
jgi:flagellar hook-basal body complex protein FliE